MPLKYTENNEWQALLPVLEEHGEWFRSAMQCLFYPVEAFKHGEMSKPTSFAQWVVEANRSQKIQPELMEKLTILHQDLLKISDLLINAAKAREVKPEWSDFKKFMTLYEEFMHHIRRLENDLVMEGSGYDSFTGLRSQNMFSHDLERELHRLARRGKSFCVALLKIDHFDLLGTHFSADEVGGYIKLIAGLIKVSIRSFDDAYYLGRDEFMLCLKQADVAGGIRALERLKRELEAQGITIQAPGESDRRLSMSCCIVEPVAEDKADGILQNLRLDLADSKEQNVDTVLQYHELSPLQRYVQSEK